MTDPVTAAAIRVATARNAAIERAAETALQGGVCGVLIYRQPDGSELIGPHSSVPYGVIHEYPQGLVGGLESIGA